MSSNSERSSRLGRRAFVATAGAAGVAGLAGCMGGNSGTKSGGGGGKNGTTTVEFWTLFGGGDGKAMKQMVGTFNEQHDSVQIKRQRLPWDQYYNKLYTALTGGNPPDLAVVHATRLAKYADVVEPLGDMAGSNVGDKYVSSIWKKMNVDGKRLALPLDTHPAGYWYNKDIFEQAGLDPEKPPESAEEFERACNAIVEKTGKLAFSPAPYGMTELLRDYFLRLRQLDGRLLTEDGKKAAFDSQKGVEVAEYLAKVSGTWNWDKASIGNNRGTKAFRAGDLAILQNGTWYYSVAEQQDFDYGMFRPFVQPGKVQNATWANSHTLAIPRNPKRSDAASEAAVTAAKWLTQEGGLTWGTVAGHLPASQSALEADELRNATVWKKSLKTFYEIAKADEIAYVPRNEKVTEYKEPIMKNLSQIYTQKVPPKQGISQAAKRVDQILSS
ncbi:extracellular solute-binding protein [Halomarina pelagica]|uniref:extracellular solute-binding protein n=1 Tax=Halomarina pelagica TaxID=2961599 RepID=UPI0020C2D7E0|nr:extracellular solute-binding protein [Halomarina sp. BND7]